MKKNVASLLIALSTLVFMLSGCQSPLIVGPESKPPVFSLAPADGGEVAEMAEQAQTTLPSTSTQVLPVIRNRDALTWRLALIDQAESSIDFQTFWWTDDRSGRLLTERLVQAARRGVRVRVIIDGMGLEGNAKHLRTFEAIPNITVSVYSPLQSGSAEGKGFEIFRNLDELNQRMHNKIIIVDGHAAVIGGRNVGDDYFGYDTEAYNFLDFDVLVMGQVLESMRSDFDLYWNHDMCVPVHAFTELPSQDVVETVLANIRAQREKDRKRFPSIARLEEEQSLKAMWDANAHLVTGGDARYYSDPRDNQVDRNKRMLTQIARLEDGSITDLFIVNPYFLPGKHVRNDLISEMKEGTPVTLIAGSLGAVNHTATFGYYEIYRDPLVRAGMNAYELRYKPGEEVMSWVDAEEVDTKYVCIHAKVIIDNRERVYIGSLNLDPRAMEINTENTMVIDSPAFAKQVRELFEKLYAPENSWQVKVNEEDDIIWVSGDRVRTRAEARGEFDRFIAWMARVLPIEDQL